MPRPIPFNSLKKNNCKCMFVLFILHYPFSLLLLLLLLSVYEPQCIMLNLNWDRDHAIGSVCEMSGICLYTHNNNDDNCLYHKSCPRVFLATEKKKAKSYQIDK